VISILNPSRVNKYIPALEFIHQYVIAQIKVGSQNSPNIVIDKKNLSITSGHPSLIFCKNSKQSICGFIQCGFDKKSIIVLYYNKFIFFLSF